MADISNKLTVNPFKLLKEKQRTAEQQASVKEKVNTGTISVPSTDIKQDSTSPFDRIKHEDEQGEFWFAKELQALLGYQGWDKFKKVIEKGKQTCTNVGENADYHIRQMAHMSIVGNGAQREVQDYRLTRYACYVIAMNGDSSKQEIAAAQTYFAVRTRQAEVQQEQRLPVMSTMEMISTIALHVDKVEKEQKRQADILVTQQEQQQELAAAIEEQDVRLNRLENQSTVTIRNFAPPDEDVKDQLNKRVKALAFNRKEQEGGPVGKHISDIWTEIYRQLRNRSYDIDEELASFKDFWTSQKNRGNKMFTQGKINGFKNLDVISAVPDIRSAVRSILDTLETEEDI